MFNITKRINAPGCSSIVTHEIIITASDHLGYMVSLSALYYHIKENLPKELGYEGEKLVLGNGPEIAGISFTKVKTRRPLSSIDCEIKEINEAYTAILLLVKKYSSNFEGWNWIQSLEYPERGEGEN